MSYIVTLINSLVLNKSDPSSKGLDKEPSVGEDRSLDRVANL
ncbi:MAG: hypothetical protein ACX93I_10880 [Winogradskyella sp.]